jgi:magnesium transporter
MKITTYNPHQPEAPQSATLDQLPELLKSDSIVWVDMVGSSADNSRMMDELFNFHPLAIEDTGPERQRPKVESYDDHLFIILNAVEMQADRVAFREISLFMGDTYLVTVHPDPDPVIAEAEGRALHFCANHPAAVGHLAYLVLDVVVDGYFPVVDKIEHEIEQIDQQIFNAPKQISVERMFDLKRMLNEIWRVGGQKQNIMGTLRRETQNFSEDKSLRYNMRDVADHVILISDLASTLRDNLTSLIDLYLSISSNRLNQKINRLTAITFGVGLLTVISGFYGMNFTEMYPPLNAEWALGFVLALMGLALLVTVVALRWLERE